VIGNLGLAFLFCRVVLLFLVNCRVAHSRGEYDMWPITRCWTD